MVLEATMIVLDNSEWMRNGDYTPTRLEAQKDCVNLLFGSKIQANPENTVGLLTMAEVLVTLTSDVGKIYSALHNIKIGGKPNLTTGIQVAQNALVTLGKKMKKNNVAVDIINFGEESENNSKLEAFINAVNSGDNSHILTVPPGPHILSDALLSSAILAGEDGVPAGFAAGGGNSFEFGVDPNLDPELALALRISLEEEKARQEAKAAEVSTTSNSNQEAESSTMAIDQTIGGGSTDKAELSTIINTENQVCSIDLGKQGGEEEKEGDKDTDDVHMEELTEDEQMARALQMSMQGDGESNVKITTDDYNVMQDPEFMSELLQSLPGVDPNDPQIRNALQGKCDALNFTIATTVA
ncbi:3168_t:CDS:2 [Entrophospora sp. SA101]|nr:3168_t:CDS:2 [Entrophospora sp. SA101]CAJ0923542.1 10883_t:CDS:2 [Entrophospora sp. SA101]